jgi:hypothetical protein
VIRQIAWSAAVVLLTAIPAFAQDYDRGWVDVDFGAANAAQRSYTSAKIVTVSQEAGGGAVAYSLPRGGSFDVGGGFMFSQHIGVGVSLAGTAHKDTAGLAISVPHPLYFNASATDASVTSGTLSRAEGAWHIELMIVALQTPHARIRVFGGPSYFRAQQDTVTAIKYSQQYQLLGLGNVVHITSYDTTSSEATAWGVHGGVDASVFFNRVFGLGAIVRVSRGTASIADYGGAHDVKLGGVQVGGGLRLKF